MVGIGNIIEIKKNDPSHKYELGKMAYFLSSAMLVVTSKIFCSLNESCEYV